MFDNTRPLQMHTTKVDLKQGSQGQLYNTSRVIIQFLPQVAGSFTHASLIHAENQVGRGYLKACLLQRQSFNDLQI